MWRFAVAPLAWIALRICLGLRSLQPEAWDAAAPVPEVVDGTWRVQGIEELDISDLPRLHVQVNTNHGLPSAPPLVRRPRQPVRAPRGPPPRGD